jgi:hypothetical protein
MKSGRWIWFLLALGLVCGCRARYEITLYSGGQVTSLGKPKLVQGYYVFKDATGKENRVSATRVRLIEPQRRGWTKEPSFTPTR